MKKKVTWILVADGARARILKNEGPGKGLQPAVDEEFHHELPRTHEMGTERPGRVHESANAARHAMENPVDWHRFEKEKFAKEMAKILDKAGAGGAFDRLVLVAPPKTLGDLRGALAAATRKKVTGELDKDLTQITLGELPEHLGPLLPV
jgi:protein required for attachment to host cells